MSLCKSIRNLVLVSMSTIELMIPVHHAMIVAKRA